MYGAPLQKGEQRADDKGDLAMTRNIVNLEDLRELARRRLPRAVFDFIDGGAEDEVTLARNRRAFESVLLKPRVMVDVSKVDPSVTLFGEQLALPLVLAPTGLCGMAAPRGEVLAARAAAKAGIPFTLSVMSGVSIEDVMHEAPGKHWFQLYIWRDRAITREVVERAREAGYTTMLVTVDTPVLGLRERDVRNGATIPPRATLRNALDVLTKFPWFWGMMRAGIDYANFKAVAQHGRFTLMTYINAQFDPSVTWDDIAWLRELWQGPLLLKGILSAADALRALDHGIDGIVVSNHGGRQLDGVPGSLEVLPAIAEAVQGRVPLILDGGVRRGSDVIKALALGANACMIGRPYLYGLGAAGEAGVTKALDILRSGIERTLALLGCPNASDLDASFIHAHPFGAWGDE